MKKLTIFLLLAVLALSGCTQTVLPKFALRTLDNPTQKTWDACDGKERCVIGYFAPWCHICHRNTKFFKEVRSQLARSPKVGVVFIVGYDTFDKCEELASEVGSPVWLDTKKEFDNVADFSSVPHFWVIDRERKVLTDFSFTGNRNDDLVEAAKYFIDETLDLQDFVNTNPPTKFREQDVIR